MKSWFEFSDGDPLMVRRRAARGVRFLALTGFDRSADLGVQLDSAWPVVWTAICLCKIRVCKFSPIVSKLAKQILAIRKIGNLHKLQLAVGAGDHWRGGHCTCSPKWQTSPIVEDGVRVLQGLIAAHLGNQNRSMGDEGFEPPTSTV